MELESIRCTIIKRIYNNAQNDYSVFLCFDKDKNDLKIVGTFPDIKKGTKIDVFGNWNNNSKYGLEFKVEFYQEVLPDTLLGIEEYLSSKEIKGVGPALAHAIVSAFGEGTIGILEHEPEKLLQVPGIGKKKINTIIESYAESYTKRNGKRDVMIFLCSYGIGSNYAARIYKTYKEKSLEVLKENPYQIANDIWGFGFETADKIALGLGVEPDSFQRLQSGLIFTLNELATDGHCYATRDMLIYKSIKLLSGENKQFSISKEVISDAIDKMIKDENVIVEQIPGSDDEIPQMAIYLPQYYYSELGVSIRLKTIYKTPRKELKNEDALFVQQNKIDYEKEQVEAIETALKSKVLVLTGGPGTGKTTCILGIINAYKAAGAEVLLAAPTGRAAKRMREVTGMYAKTIHMLLEYKKETGFQRNKDNPLHGDVLIVDECSMIDVLAMNALLTAVPDTMTVIFVGDVDQLPSVGAGNILRDIIESDAFPVIRLTKIFRQAETSKIITNAHKINQGLMPDLQNKKESDFFYLSCDDPDKAAVVITELIKDRLPKNLGITKDDIQVLSPTKKGAAGTTNLNYVLQNALNPGDDGIPVKDYVFRENDKVMQITNDYEKEVFNGDVGVIKRIDKVEKEIYVLFDTNLVVYNIEEDLDELTLAYASTIHKSQGCEYPVVIMPVLTEHSFMLQRNLVYTGVTRAKKMIIMVGSQKAIDYAVKREKVSTRNTLLAARIKNKVSSEQAVLG